MFRRQPHTAAVEKKRTPNKLIAGFAALVVTTFITASGFAAATAPNKPTKQECLAAGYHNYGQCVKEWAHHKNKPGHGYGHGYGSGNTSVATNVNLALNNSNNNIITIIVNVFR